MPVLSLLLLCAVQEPWRDFVPDREDRQVQWSIQHGQWASLMAGYEDSLKPSLQNLPRRIYYEHVISGLPPEALDAYRERHAGAAGWMTERGVDQQDERLLRQVYDRHFLTDSGAVATLALANFLADRGDPSGAATLLERLLRFHPGRSVDRTLVAARLMHCLSLTDDPDRFEAARSLIAEKEISGSIEVGRRHAITLDAYVRSLKPPRPDRQASTRVRFAGRRIKRVPAPAPYVRNELRLLSYEFTPPSWTWRHMPDRFVTGTAVMVRLDGRPTVVASDGGEVVAVDAWSGRRLWRTRSVPLVKPTNFYTGRTKHERYGNTSPLVGFARDDSTLFTLAGRSTFALPGVAHRYVWMLPRLVGLDAATGSIVWEAEASFARGDWTYCSAPVIRGDRLYTGVVAFSDGARESVVVCHDRRTGRIIWKRTVSRREDSPTRTLPLVLLALDESRLYATNDDGLVAAINPTDGSMVWEHAYAPGDAWDFLHAPGPPVVDGARLIVCPQARSRARVLDVEEGRRVTPTTTGDPSPWVTRASNPGLLLAKDGETWIASRVAGGGDLHKGYIYISQKSKTYNGMTVYDVLTGSKGLRTLPWQNRHEGGTIAVTDGIIMVQGTRLVAYTDFTGYKAELTRRMLKYPEDTDALFTLIRLGTLKKNRDVDASLLRYFLHLTKDRAAQKKRRELVAKWLEKDQSD